MCQSVTGKPTQGTNMAELQSLDDVLQRLQEDVGVVRLEDQGRPQSDGGLATASTVNPPGPQAGQHLVQRGPLSLVEECRGSSLIGRELP